MGDRARRELGSRTIASLSHFIFATGLDVADWESECCNLIWHPFTAQNNFRS